MAINNSYTVQAFAEIEYFQFSKQLQDRIKNEIESKGKTYILGIDEIEFKSYLKEKYSFELLSIDSTSEEVGEPTISIETRESRFYGENYGTDVYNFAVTYKYSGSPEFFKVKPTTWRMDSTTIVINEDQETVSFKIKLYKKDPNEFLAQKSSFFSSAFSNIENINKDITNWNNALPGIIETLFKNLKNKYLQENDFFAAINVKVNKETTSVFSSPTIKKKIIPKPPTSTTKEFSSEPTMSKEMYDDILKVIYDSGKNMEKKPALYVGKDEEGLRDQFLFVLETRYEGITATGETFNRSGKTDIILKYANDGSNLFVAECKFWHGQSEYLKAISQLFERYLTWRDSKVALIMFVTNQDFSSVLQIIQNETRSHPYFLQSVGKRGETSFSFIMSLPQDKSKKVFLEILAFHYDKNKEA